MYVVIKQAKFVILVTITILGNTASNNNERISGRTTLKNLTRPLARVPFEIHSVGRGKANSEEFVKVRLLRLTEKKIA